MAGISVRLDNETHRRLKHTAFWQGETMGDIIKIALDEYLDARPSIKEKVRTTEEFHGLVEELDDTG